MEASREQEEYPNELCFLFRAGVRTVAACSLYSRKAGDRPPPACAKPSRSTAIMNQSTQRLIIRCIHLVFSIPIIGYAYSPFEELPNYAPVVRFVAVPAIALTGLWMWKGHVVRRLVSKRPAGALE
jgi:hypothetical protein